MLKDNLNQKANFTFYYLLSISLSFFIFLLFLSKGLYPKLFLIEQSLVHKFIEVCDCANHFLFSNHSFIFIFFIVLSSGLVLFFGFMLIQIVKFKLATSRFIKLKLKSKKLKFSSKLSEIAEAIGLISNLNLIEISENRPIAFCFGFFKPKICISSGLVKKLSKLELRAVLLHEKHHLIFHEPIKTFVAKALAKILFFLPGVRALAKQYLTFSELAADEWATNNFQDKIFLAKALYKVMKWEEQLIIKNHFAISFFDSIIGERVTQLAPGRYQLRFKWFIFQSGFIILLIFISPLLLNTLWTNNFLTHEMNDGVTVCALKPIIHQSQCQPADERLTCSIKYGRKSGVCEKHYLNQ